MGITSRAVYAKLKKYEINLAEFRIFDWSHHINLEVATQIRTAR